MDPIDQAMLREIVHRNHDELLAELVAVRAERDDLKAKLADSEREREALQKAHDLLNAGFESATERTHELKQTVRSLQAELHRWQHGQQIEGDYVCAAAEKERAARLKAEAACAAKDDALLLADKFGSRGEIDEEGERNGMSVSYFIDKALATDAGQPILDFIAAARRLNDGVKLFIKVMNGARMSELDKCPTFDQLVRDMDAAAAKLHQPKGH